MPPTNDSPEAIAFMAGPWLPGCRPTPAPLEPRALDYRNKVGVNAWFCWPRIHTVSFSQAQVFPRESIPSVNSERRNREPKVSTTLLGGDPVVVPIQISRLAGGLRLHGHDHEGHQLMASSGLDPGGLMLLVLHSDSPLGIIGMGRSRWSESVVPRAYYTSIICAWLYLKLPLYDSAFLPSVDCGPAEKGREGKGPLPAEQTWPRRPAEKGSPYCPMVGLHPTGNWQREGGNSGDWWGQTRRREGYGRELH